MEIATTSLIGDTFSLKSNVNFNGDEVDYDAANTDAPCFDNSTLHSLFYECGVTANGIKIHSANGHYAQETFIETEFPHNEAKETWLRYLGNSYETRPYYFTTTLFTKQPAETKESNIVSFIGKLASDFVSCDKHLISGVNLGISFLKNCPE